MTIHCSFKNIDQVQTTCLTVSVKTRHHEFHHICIKFGSTLFDVSVILPVRRGGYVLLVVV